MKKLKIKEVSDEELLDRYLSERREGMDANESLVALVKYVRVYGYREGMQSVLKRYEDGDILEERME